MLIKPSTALRHEYNAIADLCKEKQEPVFLTKNGEGYLGPVYTTATPQQ